MSMEGFPPSGGKKSESIKLPDRDQGGPAGPAVPEFMQSPFFPRFQTILSKASNPTVIGLLTKQEFPSEEESKAALAYMDSLVAELEKYRQTDTFRTRQTGPAIVPIQKAAVRIEDFRRIQRSLQGMVKA